VRREIPLRRRLQEKPRAMQSREDISSSFCAQDSPERYSRPTPNYKEEEYRQTRSSSLGRVVGKSSTCQ
jgi:hypothetical protein